MPPDTKEKLDRLANFQAERDYLQLKKKELIDQTIPPEIKARLEEIELEFAAQLAAVDENLKLLEEEIRFEILTHGESVRGEFLVAQWCKGHVSWDTKSLDDYAVDHPEIKRFRKEGAPYTQIRKVGH
jgi:hypothetical protein